MIDLNVIKEKIEKEKNVTVVMLTKFGSHLYGTSTPESDIDLKGIYIPKKINIIMPDSKQHFTMNTNNSHSKNTKDDMDIEMFSLYYFLQMAIKGETVALDMLHSPRDMHITDNEYLNVWEYIQLNKELFYTIDMKAYLGYVKKQAAKYGIKGTRLAALRTVMYAVKYIEVSKQEEHKLKELRGLNELITNSVKLHEVKNNLPINEYCKFTECSKTGSEFYEVMGSKHQLTITLNEFKTKITKEWEKYGERARLAEKNEGVDWKAMHHAIRGGMQLKEIYSTNNLIYPLKEADTLLKIKKGEIDFKDVSTLLEEIVSDVETLSKNLEEKGMRHKVDQSFWNNFCYTIYESVILGENK